MMQRFELRTMDNALVAKGELDFVLAKFVELGGVLGVTHFFMPASWEAGKVLTSIKRCGPI